MGVTVHSIRHLARRFFGSLRPRMPSEDELAWVRSSLSEGEFGIWSSMSTADQRHSIDVARAVEAALPTVRDQSIWAPAVAAALVHDSGKVVSGFGTGWRVVATVARPLIGRNRRGRWLETGGRRERFVLYWRHPAIGGERLAEAGSHPTVHRWATEHHWPEDRWTVPIEVGRLLQSCDDD